MPFVEDHMILQSQKSLLMNVIGWEGESPSPHLELLPEEQVERLTRNHQRFLALPFSLQQEIRTQLSSLETRSALSFQSKTQRVFSIFAYEIHPFLQAWVLFSLILCFLLFFRIEGAVTATWLLPLLSVVYFFFLPSPPPQAPTIWPSEQMIVEEYLEEPLDQNISIQREQLTQGWQHYLVRHWLHEEPQADPAAYQEQVERGEYRFQLARIQHEKRYPPTRLPPRPSLVGLSLLLIWNLFFAWQVTRKRVH